MPGETPDWGALSGQATVFPVTDLGELAARLGSIDRFDRRGDVIFMDDFADGLGKWVTGTAGTGAAADLSFSEVRNGMLSCRLLAGSDGTRQALIYRALSFPALSGMGLEVSFQIPPFTEEIQFLFSLYDGVNFNDFRVIWRDTDDDLQYRDSNGDHVTFQAGVDLSIWSSLFHVMKMVVDADAKTYVRVILDDQEYSLAGIAAEQSANATLPMLRPRIQNHGRAGANDVVYLGDVIVTQNEPL